MRLRARGEGKRSVVRDTVTGSEDDPQTAKRGNPWRPVLVAFAVLLVIAIVLSVSAYVVGRNREAVANPSAATSLNGWTARSDVGPVEMRRMQVNDGPDGISTAVEVRRRNSEIRDWARVTIAIDNPAQYFEVGQSYRLSAYVRNFGEAPQSIGILLANENYEHRPTPESRYQRIGNDGWHQLTLTFTCTQPAAEDTAVYIALPMTGKIQWQIAGVSLQKTRVPQPPHVDGDPNTVLTFDGPAGARPDDQVWNYDVGGHGWGNEELQTYTEDPRNASMDGEGNLVITARREDHTGEDGILRHYTSARLNTYGKIQVSPGSYVEATIVAPVGAGVWPAFWTLGSNIYDVGWPACGELDILEVVGSNPATVHNAIHMADKDDPKKDRPYGDADEGGSTALPRTVDSRPHRYGVYFDENLVTFYVDEEPTLVFTASAARASDRTWPFDRPQFIVLNIAVGGREPVDTTFPRTMEVSNIKIWEGGIPF